MQENRISHQSSMQTEKSQPEGKRIMPETRFTEYPALFFDRGLEFLGLHRRPQTEKSQPEGKRIMPETKFTSFPALFVDPRVGNSRSASETDLFFLPMTFDFVIYHSQFLLFF